MPYHWSYASNLAKSGFFTELGFSEEAIEAANLAEKRIEFHPVDKRWFVRGGEVAIQSHEEGHNFVHTCPPDCS